MSATLEAAKPAGWTPVQCHGCGGHGDVCDYHNEDFYGAKECDICGGSGSLSKSPSGRLAMYPGGPFRGSEPR